MNSSKRSTARKAREEEILNSPVNMNGVGEDQVIKDLLSPKFTEGTNQEAADIGIALRQLISGQNLLLQNQEKQSEEMARIHQRMADMDAAVEKWEKDKNGFIQEISDKMDRIRTASPDQIIAKGAIQFQEAVTNARAEMHVERLKFKERLSRMPTEMVISPGELVGVMEGGRQTMKILPEVIRIKDMQWVLQPGVMTEVPQVVAEVIRNKRRSEKETQAREDLLQKNYEQPVLQQKWAELNSAYKSPTQQ